MRLTEEQPLAQGIPKKSLAKMHRYVTPLPAALPSESAFEILTTASKSMLHHQFLGLELSGKHMISYGKNSGQEDSEPRF